MTSFALRLSFALAAILLFIVSMVASCISYKKKHEIDYSLKSMFPIEFNYERSFNENLLGNFCLILSFFSSICFYVTYNLSFNFDTLTFVTVFGCISVLLIAGIFFLPLNFFRAHISIDILAFAMIFALSAGTTIAAFRLFQKGNNAPTAMIGFVLGILVSLIVFALIMNPKLTANIKGTVVKDEKGNEKIIRPKFIILAFSEWVLIFSFFINIAISFLISFSLIS